MRISDRDSAHCTCPSEQFPCKHVRALEATWKQNPDSFFDLVDLMNQLERKPKAELLALISEMAMAAPESLAACGIEEFDDEQLDDEYD